MNNTFETIKGCINDNKSFILEAWAGSWKTYTLIQTIKLLLEKFWDNFAEKWQKIACITYTNVAKDELVKRLDYNELVEINTIHEFLWSIISNYQSNLKKELLKYHETFDEDKKNSNLEELLLKKNITYWKYWRRLDRLEIGHDDVINLSVWLFNTYPKLKKILINKFPYFFIDEYQDTFKCVVDVFISILEWNEGKFLIWFFWDFMQKIYDDNRIGRINDESLVIIQKKENFRSWKKIVNLINKVRSLNDDLIQCPQTNFDWNVKFYYTNSDISEEEKYNFMIKRLKRKLNCCWCSRLYIW